MMEVVKFGTNSLEKGTGHYRFSRYEDICLDFKLETQRLINFVDLPWQSEFEEYISKVENFDEVSEAHRRATQSLKKRIGDQVDHWREEIDLSALL